MENIMELSEIINQKVYNLLDIDFAQKCKKDLDQNGVLTLSNFLNANTLKELVVEAEDAASQAYYTNSTHNVYLTKIDNKLFNGMMNIGHRPTIGAKEKSIEVYLFNFDRDIYNKIISIDVVEKIRDEKKFMSIEALKTQLSKDEEHCLTLINK